MAKNKIQRIDQEISKVREKIAEYQDKLKTLEDGARPAADPGAAERHALRRYGPWHGRCLRQLQRTGGHRP